MTEADEERGDQHQLAQPFAGFLLNITIMKPNTAHSIRPPNHAPQLLIGINAGRPPLMIFRPLAGRHGSGSARADPG